MRTVVWVGAVAVIAGSGLIAAERDGSPDLRVTLSGHRGGVTAITFNGKGDEIATGAGNGVVRIWNSKTGALAVKLEEFKGISITGLAFSPDGSILAASGKGKVGMWTATTEMKGTKSERSFKWTSFPSTDAEGLYSDVGVPGDGKEVYFARRHYSSSFPGRMFRYDKAHDVTEERPGPKYLDPRAVACISDPDSGVVAVYGIVGEKATAAVLLYGLGEAKVITRGVPPLATWFKLTDQTFTSLRNAKMPEIVLARINSLKDKELSRDDLQKEIAKALSWSELMDQTFLILRNAKVPDAVLTKLNTLKNKEFSRDDLQNEIAKVLTPEETKQFQDIILSFAKVITFEETKQLQDIILSHAQLTKEAPLRITFSTDGKWLAAYSGTLAVWPVPGSHIIVGDPATLGNVYAAAIGPDNLLATVSPPDEFRNATINLWSLGSQARHYGIFGIHWVKQIVDAKKVATYHSTLKDVSCLAFSPGGRTLAVGGSTDGVVQLWNMDD